MEGWMMLRVSVFTKSPCPGRSPFSGQALPSPHSSPAMALLTSMAFEGKGKTRTGAEVRMWQSQPCLCWGEVPWRPTPVLLPGKSLDGGAWWAAVSGVAQSQTRLKRLSSRYMICQGFLPFYWLPFHCGDCLLM